jgi:pyridinium-3,5-bisthiocarboxylic acid mononucleotide nickel chelatase
MKTLYLDVFSGISGDMFLGALLDLGADFQRLEHDLEKLGLDGYHLHVSKQQRAHIAGTKFDVHLEEDHHHDESQPDEHERAHEHGHHHSHGHEHHHHDEASAREHEACHGHEHSRTFADIEQLIERSSLSDWVKQKSIAIFRRVAVAEGKIHGQPPEQVHFHEVGAVDSIIDIVGGCLALELLGRPRLLAAPVVEGTGWVKCAHGRFPVPTPATLEILGARGVPVSQCDEPHELVTPTGAALLAELVESFGPMRDLKTLRVGYGLGMRENKTRPNVLRAVLCETADTASGHDWETDTVAVLQTNLDDANAEVLGAFAEKALALGALDIFHTPVQMKKNRPGVLLTLLCAEGDADKFAELILKETTAFGVRRHVAERRKLRREFATVKTPFGDVTVKLGKMDGQVVQAAPEYESCKRLAEQANVPLKQVYEAANRVVQL